MRKLLAGLLLAGAASAAEPEKAPEPQPEPKRAVFIPETVKAELREEIRKEVLEQARRENWAAPQAIPDWLRRLRFAGDVRARFERDLFPRGNASSGDFPDFNAINTGKAFDVNFVDVSGERYLNVDQNRTRPRLRARFGVDADIVKSFAAGLRLATGESSNPGSENQTLGASGGMFGKVQLWLDRGFLRWSPSTSISVRLGRFENPFSGTDLLWSPDLNFDGAVLEARADPAKPLAPFAVLGAFSLYNTAFAFPAEQGAKFLGRNKWLYGAQLGADWKPARTLRLRAGAAFYYFDKVEGRASQPCDTNLSSVSCTTDESRPSFAQKGNTYLALRTPSTAALLLESSSTVARYQYFGLASRFRELELNARLAADVGSSALLEIEGDYVRNAGFNRHQIEGVALNNHGAVGAGEVIGPYRGGNNGVLGRAGLGSPSQGRQWDWKVRLGYRYLESDAVLDAFNDQDFGLGGTNLKGISLDATLWVPDSVSLTARWFSADQVVGPTYAVDVFHLDLYARF